MGEGRKPKGVQTMTVASLPDLAGRSVLVTGGASGIGAALVDGFARQGARVAFIDIDQKAGNALAADLTASGFTARFFMADLTDIAATRAAVDAAASAHGPITVLVNNAARDDRMDLASVTPESWRANLAVNLDPVFFVSQAVAPMMKAAGGGAIINFSSIAYLLNMGNLPAYGTAKAAIIGLTKSLAGALGPDGIRVNAVLPGMVLTERQKALWITDADAAAMIERQCLKFNLGPEHMVGPVLYLASNLSSGMTAQTMIIDGGCL